jgi:hypothetical protein
MIQHYWKKKMRINPGITKVIHTKQKLLVADVPQSLKESSKR